jgi:hypothetical protein
MAWLWNSSVFGSAFLLFLVQPMLAKWLLPAFGGSPSTWAACMVFFQSMLLLGYAYAHALTRLRRLRVELAVHGCVTLVAAALAIQMRALSELEASSLSPVLRIAWLLLRQAGAPYLLLASTSPLLQRWAAVRQARAPHQLYAVSNAGSLLGLLGYPIWIESALPIDAQFRCWSLACVALAAAVIGCAWITSRAAHKPLVELTRTANDRSDAWRWTALAFVPSVFLLAVTNHITVDIAPTPLLWVVPLVLYLVSFIVAFAGIAAVWRAALLPLFIVLSLGLAYNAFAQGSASLVRQLGFSLSGLFVAGLLSHDALARSRPAGVDLTRFYLWIAFGGALGGVFVSVLAPLMFDDYYELELAIVLTYVVLLWFRPSHDAAPAPAATAQRRGLLLGLGLCLPLLAANVALRASGEGRTGRVLERRRSFLGALRVVDLSVGRVLTHGRIRHGMQLSGNARKRWPTMYFGPGTALARVLAPNHGVGARRIGVVGLGVGTLAAYGRAGDVLRFYELDPNVLAMAQHWFTFLRDSPAQVQFALGDGRLLLAHEPAQRFDVLVLDAFSSDAVPAHLLTREAFAIYLRHVAPQGVLLANVSNRHLAVDRVVRASARAHGLICEVVETAADTEHFVSKVRWAVMAREAGVVAAQLGDTVPAAASGPDVLWTDAQASVWSILR